MPLQIESADHSQVVARTVGKHCKDCGQEKPFSEFGRNPHMADGHINRCKHCSVPYLRKYQRGYKYPPKLRLERLRRYRRDHPEANRAQRMLNWHVRAGNISTQALPGMRRRKKPSTSPRLFETTRSSVALLFMP